MAASCLCDCSSRTSTYVHSWCWWSLGQESQRGTEGERDRCVRKEPFLSVKKKKMEVQSLEFRLSDRETESAEAEGPGS